MMRSAILNFACWLLLLQPLLGANIKDNENKNNIGKPDIPDNELIIKDTKDINAEGNITISNSPQQAGPCYSGRCYNGGTCMVVGSGFSCYCDPKYFGLLCEKKCNCKNGRCSEGGGGTTLCQCLPGYGPSGVNKCKACNCGKFASCQFKTQFFKEIKECLCAVGQREEKGTCVGTELCGRENKFCKHGLCVKGYPTSYCDCDDGYYQPYCEQKPLGGKNMIALIAGIVAVIAFISAVTLFSLRYMRNKRLRVIVR